jgi:hypothetical protein
MDRRSSGAIVTRVDGADMMGGCDEDVESMGWSLVRRE